MPRSGLAPPISAWANTKRALAAGLIAKRSIASSPVFRDVVIVSGDTWAEELHASAGSRSNISPRPRWSESQGAITRQDFGGQRTHSVPLHMSQARLHPTARFPLDGEESMVWRGAQ